MNTGEEILLIASGMLLAVGASFAPIDCPQILERFSEQSSGGCFRKDLLLDDQFIPQISCHFENQHTLYLYREHGEIKLDVKANRKSETHTFKSCEALANEIENIQNIQPTRTEKSHRRSWSSNENVALVASEKNCATLQAPLEQWLSLLHREGRFRSHLLCIPQRVISQNNPSTARTWIRNQIHPVDGIILVGVDIPTFEYFHRTGYGPGWAEFAYGITDLPYGSLEDQFWDQWISKKSASLRERVYKAKNFLYPMDRPTEVAFDLDQFSSEIRFSSQYTQHYWVSRWLGEDPEHLSRWLHRRATFQPPQQAFGQYHRGGESFMWRPGDHEILEIVKKDLSDWGDRLNIFTESDLKNSVRFLDPHLEWIAFSEHGQPEAIGNLHASHLKDMAWLPSFVHWDTCLGGSWAYATHWKDSLIHRTLQVDQAPLAILASAGIKWWRTIGKSGLGTAHIFLSPLEENLSMGARQVLTVNRNLELWRKNPRVHYNRSPSEVPMQIFHAVSLFGDGSIELY